MIKNTAYRYGAVSQFFHWSMALLMISLAGVGLWMMDLPPDNFKWFIYGWHKQLGITVFALVVLRYVWRAYNVQPHKPASLSTMQHMAAQAAHYALYGVMLAMPISGYIMSMAGGHGVNWFGVQLPDLIGKNPELGGIAREIHEYVGYAFWGLLALHAGAALWHHFVQKDDVLTRMLPKFSRS